MKEAYLHESQVIGQVHEMSAERSSERTVQKGLQKGYFQRGACRKSNHDSPLTRLGRLRAWSGSKLPTANVPLRALDGWGAKDDFISVGVRSALFGVQTKYRCVVMIGFRVTTATQRFCWFI